MWKVAVECQVYCTCLVYFFIYFAFGAQFVTKFITGVFYLTKLKVDDISFWQGASTVVSECSMVFYTLPSGYLCDKYGNARFLLSILLFTSFLGFIIYSVSYSIASMFIGLFLQAAFYGMMTICCGEVSKIFDGNSISWAYSFVTLGMSLGLTITPIISYALSDIQLQVWSISITSLNALPLFCACLVAAMQVLLIFFQHNSEDIRAIVKIEGFKIVVVEIESQDLIEQTQIKTSNLGPTETAKQLLSHYNTFLIYTGTFIWLAMLYAFEYMLPLVSVKWFHITSHELHVVYLINGILASSLSILFLCLSNTNDYDGTLALASSQLLVPLLLIVLSYLRHFDNGATRPIYFAWILIGTLSWFIDGVFARALYSQLVPIEVQSYADAIRSIAGTVARFLAGGIVWAWFKYTVVVSTILIIFESLQIVAMFLRHKQLRRPTRIKIQS